MQNIENSDLSDEAESPIARASINEEAEEEDEFT